MSATAPIEALVARPETAQDIAKILQMIHKDETSRRRRQILMTVAPWVISSVFGLFAVGAGIIVAKRPIPVPQVHVAIYRSDGTVEAPVDRGNLTLDRKQFIERADLQQFIIAWESYVWGAQNQANYDRVSAMTAGEPLQASYQSRWHKTSDPENPNNKYGQTVTRNVAMIMTSYVPRSQYSLSARMLIKTTTANGSTCEWWAANLTFKPDTNTIPLDKQLAYDPSDVIVSSYFSTAADPSARPVTC